MKRAILNLDEVVSAYKDTPNLHDLAKRFHTSHIRLSQFLTENGVKIQNRGKKRNIDEKMVSDMIYDYTRNLMTMDGISKKYNLRVKRIREIFREKNIKISKWNGHKKKVKQINTQKINKTDDREYVTCPICGWVTYDIQGKAHSFQKHMCMVHGYNRDTILGYIEEHPEHEYLLKDLVKKRGKVQCKVCGKWLSIIDDRHLKKHGLTKSEYLAQYGSGETISESCRKKLQENMKKMQDNPNWERFTSSYETEIADFLLKNGLSIEKHNRAILNGKEIDILCGDTGIEFNGCLQHTEWFGGKDKHYHLSKTEGAIDKGYRLIHIFEDEYFYHKDIVLSKILHILGVHNNIPSIYARKCIVNEISAGEAETFLEKNHIQGFSGAGVYLGAFYEGKLIAVMTFRHASKDTKEWELTRFATDSKYRCVGVGGKLFNYFVKKYDPSLVKSFADRRWTIDYENNLYTKLGFKYAGFTSPDYKYYNLKDNKPQRFHKFGFRKQRLISKFGNSYELTMDMTETEMAKALGYDRIWDCGLIKYVWTKENPGD